MLFEHGFYLTKPIWALIYLHDATWVSLAAMTHHFASMTLSRCYDIRKFDADTILFIAILCKKKDILMFKHRFSAV